MAPAAGGIELRAFGFVTRMQPKYAAYEGTVADGDIPLAGMAQLVVEIAPGNEIYRLADAALKATSVRPGAQVVEREFGFLELHAHDPEQVEEAGRVVLTLAGLTERDRLRPHVVSSQVITNVTPFQAQLVNRARKGSLLVPSQALLVLEVAPAAYALLAANEAEKAARIDLVDVRAIGRFGRLLVAGEESDVRQGGDAALDALSALDGRSPTGVG